VFLGEYEYVVDEKGRVPVPPRYREMFRGGAVVTRHLDRCIALYTPADWEQVSKQFAALPVTRSATRLTNRTIFSGAFTVDMDRQGRIILPQPLREYAQIRNGVTIAGAGMNLEVWSRESWAEQRKLMDEQASTIAESVDITPWRT
jgi:MraZ protein